MATDVSVELVEVESGLMASMSAVQFTTIAMTYFIRTTAVGKPLSNICLYIIGNVGIGLSNALVWTSSATRSSPTGAEVNYATVTRSSLTAGLSTPNLNLNYSALILECFINHKHL